MVTKKGAGKAASRPIRAPLWSYPPDSSVRGIDTARRLLCTKPRGYCLGGWSLLALRKLSPPSREISEFSTRRSAIAVAMVVLWRMLPHSEKGVLVVIMVERLWLWRVE